ncbi:multidrug DMT transporter permease [Paraburkholderia monticola]|uniref:Multidrug DMT transporter permease n=1 Tax=Paraburkholderia monticola TaxID=1399968 RepID=A0A149PDK5_9BURK|nr:DMT family transporter [Paraburkholderia monticola]KXU83113.1 multidrug DMT transporter permease [Paraburkholderia monticola]
MRFRSSTSADLLLLVVAFIWGTSYAVVKSALLVYPVLGLLALRFGLTFVLLSPSLWSMRGLSRSQWARIVGAGCVLLGIFLAETFGVRITSASNAAFLISLCVVMTPLVEWAWLRRAPRGVEWVAAGLSLLGAFLLGGGRFDFTPGDGLVVLAALLRAINVCATKRVMQVNAVSPLAMTAVQSGVVSFGCAVLALTVARSEWQPLPAFAGYERFWMIVVYLVVGCTLFAFFVQNYAVSRSTPTRVALLMGSEPVFGALFASVWLGERVTVLAAIGGGLIVLASVLASIKGKDRRDRDIVPGFEEPKRVAI